MLKLIINNNYQKKEEVLTDSEKEETIVDLLLTHGFLDDKDVIFLNDTFRLIPKGFI
ncbi:hypothetical protein ACTOJ1_000073 [Shigella flexneri]